MLHNVHSRPFNVAHACSIQKLHCHVVSTICHDLGALFPDFHQTDHTEPEKDILFRCTAKLSHVQVFCTKCVFVSDTCQPYLIN